MGLDGGILRLSLSIFLRYINRTAHRPRMNILNLWLVIDLIRTADATFLITHHENNEMSYINGPTSLSLSLSLSHTHTHTRTHTISLSLVEWISLLKEENIMAYETYRYVTEREKREERITYGRYLHVVVLAHHDSRDCRVLISKKRNRRST